MKIIVAVDRNPYSDDDNDADDVVAVIADDLDSPVQSVENLGDNRAYELVTSFTNEDDQYTPRQVVGLFGMRGMYREDKTNAS